MIPVKSSPSEAEDPDSLRRNDQAQFPFMIAGIVLVVVGVLCKAKQLYGQLGTILLLISVPITAILAFDFLHYRLTGRRRRRGES